METINRGLLVPTKLKELLLEIIDVLRTAISPFATHRQLTIIVNILRELGIFGSFYLTGSKKWAIYWMIVPVLLVFTHERLQKKHKPVPNPGKVSEKNIIRKLTYDYDLPIWGVLRVNIIEAKNLINAYSSFFSKDTSDVYTVIYLGEDKFETPKVKEKAPDPKWDYCCEFKVFPDMSYDLYFEVWDKNLMGGDEFLGRLSIDIRAVAMNGSLHQWFDLEDVKHGSLYIDLSWYELTNDPNDLQIALQQTNRPHVSKQSSAILSLFIDSAKNIQHFNTKSMPDPYVICSVNDQHEKSNITMRTNSPIWQQGLSLLVQDPQSDQLKIEIFDNKTDVLLGEFEFEICELYETKDMEMGLQIYYLDKSAAESEITMALSLAILKKIDETNYDEQFLSDDDFDSTKRQLPIWLNEASLQFSDVDALTNQNLTFVDHKFQKHFDTTKENNIFAINEVSTAMKKLFSKINDIPMVMTVVPTQNSIFTKLSSNDNFCHKFSAIMKFPYSHILLSSTTTPRVIQCLNEEAPSTSVEQILEC